MIKVLDSFFVRDRSFFGGVTTKMNVLVTGYVLHDVCPDKFLRGFPSV